MKNILKWIIIIGSFASCSSKESCKEKVQIIKDTIKIKKVVVDTIYVTKTNEYIQSSYYIIDRLPDKYLKSNVIDNLIIKDKFKIDNRMNPLYFEEDFNGDGHLDVTFPVRHIESKKVGFVIVHGNTEEVYIIGAGNNIKNGLSENMDYIDIWKINREKVNEPGLEENTGTGKNGELILKNPSLQIEKSELGGGQIYWNGKEYVYFHQTC
ncbi:hypothetical protein [Tenacibaculum sp. M341]|uniref:hypothetical protein n=1 Tax=Tenacibaculum sp. M341 TaxID=2530339 RepID=UPI001050F17E|nr:hypothetical protein [Tenacibaculum sp. M341]TCI93156.1 hypothetical protein EYW44_05935 [Tenacibaculum sp. M341]